MTTTACMAVLNASESPGADNYTIALQELDVCSPAPPTCGEFGWLEPVDIPGIKGVSCESSMPTPEQLEVPRRPTCDDVPGGSGGPVASTPTGGCGCVADQPGGTGGALLTFFALLGIRLRRRRG